jgi:iron complex outermembrane receptor protein
MVVGLAAPGVAQTPGQLSGMVRDQTGAPLAGVVVTARGAGTWEAVTGSGGEFQLQRLPVGEYEVSAALNGFETARQAIRLEPGQALTISFTLSVALLQELVVTAAKTGGVDLQSVPIAVGVVSDDELSRLSTRTIDQAAALLPSVTFTQNSTFGQLSIRGVGTNLVNAGGDPSSAMYLDGVYLARPAMAFVDFLDLERIEVLRGPQGTLYGRNAVGGALNLISKVPTNDREASARFTGGTLGEIRAEGRLSGPLTRDRVMASIAFARGTRDGYVRDLEHPEHRLGGDDLTAARGQLRIAFGPSSEVLVSSDVTDQDGTPLSYNKVLQAKPGFVFDNPADFHDVRTSFRGSGRILQYGGSARLTAALTPSTTLVSLSAFRRLDNRFHLDVDMTELDLAGASMQEWQRQWSHETTIAQNRSRLNWIAGVFLFQENDDQTIWADQTQAGFQVLLDPRVDAGSAALFGQATLRLTSALSGTAGLRYTRERKDIDNAGGRYTRLVPPTEIAGSGYAYSDSILHKAWTPKFGVEVKVPRPAGALAYVSATKGFKSGGFNISSMQPGRGFAPEWAWNYEGGFKSEIMGGRARLNLAAFQMDYTNLQVQTPIGIGVFDIRNAAAATIRGLEAEGAIRLGRGFDAGGHATWLDATYDRYIAVAMGGVLGDVAGNRLNNAPEWAGRVWAEWSGSPGTTDLISVTIDATAQSTVYFTPFNDDIQRQAPYALVGARAEYGPRHRRWSVNAYVKNLTATEYVMATFATSPAAFAGRQGASRELGIQLVLQR